MREKQELGEGRSQSLAPSGHPRRGRDTGRGQLHGQSHPRLVSSPWWKDRPELGFTAEQIFLLLLQTQPPLLQPASSGEYGLEPGWRSAWLPDQRDLSELQGPLRGALLAPIFFSWARSAVQLCWVPSMFSMWQPGDLFSAPNCPQIN